MRRSLAVAVLCALALPAIALAGNGGLAPVEPASPNAEGINDSYLWISIFTGAILVLVQGSLLWFIVRYRRGRRPRTEDGAQVHGNTNLELAWTVAPVLVLVAIGAFVFYKLPGIEDVPSASAQGGRVDVQVKGYRYYWNFTYPNGVIAVDRLRAPVGQTVRLEVTAPDFDVIHSWWIPALGGKFDAIPGVTNETWFNAEGARDLPRPVRGVLRHPARGHARRGRGDAARGVRRVAGGRGERAGGRHARSSARRPTAASCAKCHGLAGEGDIGPRLAGNQLLDDPAALEQLIRNGRNQMPPVGRDWEERQMKALTDYLGEGELGGG